MRFICLGYIEEGKFEKMSEAEQKAMMEEQARMAAEQARIATETGRIKQALDGVSSPVLMLDADLHVIYRNDAALTMFRDGEAEIRKALPQFSASDLMGKGVDYHASQTPVRRAGRPEDIAAATSFLVREEASYITGQVIGVNGGRNT